MPQPKNSTAAKKDDAPKAPRDKAEAFRRVAGRRTNNALKALTALQNCSNRNTYEYTDEQVDKILNAVDTAAENLHNAFRAAKREKSEFTL